MKVTIPLNILVRAALITLPAVSTAQVTVSGPSCVIPGTIYQYLISGPWDSTTTMQICLTGGLTADSSQACTTSGQPRASVLVVWSSAGNASVQVTSSNGNASLNVTIVDTLSGGTIDSIGKSQAIPYDSVPSAITCPPATGGSCSPSYQYQWQESVDRVSWQDITGATSQNLAPAQSLQQGTFFRRKVTDSTSGTIAYSDIASVDVGPPSPGTSSGPRMPLPGQDMASIRPIANLKLF